MSDSPQIKNIFEPANPMAYGNMGYGAGAAGLGGAGGAALGALFGSALGGNGGLFGNRGGNAEYVTPMQLASSTASIIDSNQNTTLLQAVGDTKAAIPVAAQGTQLYVANAMSDLRSHLGQVENSLSAGQMAINKNVSDAIASSLASQNMINMNVLQSAAITREAVTASGTANLIATKDAATANALAVANSTKEIIAALNEQNTANLQRQLTVAEQALLETRAESRARGTEVNVTQTVNQNQLQMQAQQQQQRLEVTLGNIWERMNSMQNAIATNSNMIIGNTGAVATGPNTANPVNVRT